MCSLYVECVPRTSIVIYLAFPHLRVYVTRILLIALFFFFRDIQEFLSTLSGISMRVR